MTTIWHNPRCSKSRQTLALLEERGISFETRLYLEDTPNVAELKDVAQLLGMRPIDFTRTKESAFAEQGLTKKSSADEMFAAMAAAPILIERPIVIHDGIAAIGRPPETVLNLFK